MRKLFIIMSIIMAMAMSVPVFADDWWQGEGFYTKNGQGSDVYYLTSKPNGNSNYTFIVGTIGGGNGGGTSTATSNATGGNATGGNATVNNGITGNFNIGNKVLSPEAKAEAKAEVNNVNTNVGINTQKQQMKQGQIQGQSMNNDQVIAPSQSIVIEAAKAGVGVGTVLPGQGVPELNFGAGSMKDVTLNIPKFAIYGYLPYHGEAIMDVLNVNANVKFKNLFGAILADAKKIADKGYKNGDVKVLVFMADAQKSWTTGGNLGAGGAGAIGTGGASLGGSIVPQWGGTKADPLFTIIYVKVAK